MRLNIPPDDPRHKNLIELMNRCFDLSEKYMNQRHPKWNKSEKMDRSFIDVTETDKKGKKKNPFERQIYIPMSRACKDTVITYWLQVMTAKRPIFSIAGRAPEDVRPAMLNEIVLDYQMERQRAVLVIYQYLNDVLKYSLGDIKNLFVRRYAPDPWDPERSHLAYEGPELSNTDPYKFFPDPRVSMANHQNGQFRGYEYKRSWHYLKQKAYEGLYFNIGHLRSKENKISDDTETTGDTAGVGSERDSLMEISAPDGTEDVGLDTKNPSYQVRELYLDIIPQSYDLDKSQYPQRWVFTSVNKKILIRADRLTYGHGNFPAVLGQHDYDAHSLFTPSFYESIEGLQDLLNWMYNSHIANVRAFLNDALVVDPLAVNIKDITRPNPPKIIRLQKSLWMQGINIDSVLKQLKVHDVTQSHIQDAALISDMMQRRTHTPDSLQGIETEVKRTATEIARMSTSGANILAAGASLHYAQALVPLAEMCVMNNQQFLSRGRYYRILGDYASDIISPDPRFKGHPAVYADPGDIRGYFDFPVDDGRLPVQPERNAELWMKLFEIMCKFPTIGMEYDISMVFKQMAQALGAKNIDKFKIKAQVLPDEKIRRLLSAGDINPLKQLTAEGA